MAGQSTSRRLPSLLISNTTSPKSSSSSSSFSCRRSLEAHVKQVHLLSVFISLAILLTTANTILSLWYIPRLAPPFPANNLPHLQGGGHSSVPFTAVLRPAPSSLAKNVTKIDMKNTTTTESHGTMRDNVSVAAAKLSKPPTVSQLKAIATNQNHAKHTTTKTTQTHAIPRVLTFTYFKNLLMNGTVLDDDEERVLAANVKHTISMMTKKSNMEESGYTIFTNSTSNPSTSSSSSSSSSSSLLVRFMTDDDCIRSLQGVFPSLVGYFQQEPTGMYKADICRGSALYETGGWYFDVDVGVRTNVWSRDLVAPTTEFVTSLVHRQSHYPKHFFQAVIGIVPKSPILYNYLERFHRHYRAKEQESQQKSSNHGDKHQNINRTSIINNETTEDDIVRKGPLGVILLRRAFNEVYNPQTRMPRTELWQEVLYQRQLFPHLHPAPTWGTRRACHFVVVARVSSAHHAELVIPASTPKDDNNTRMSEGEKSPSYYQIPLYSRIGGSRMCPLL